MTESFDDDASSDTIRTIDDLTGDQIESYWSLVRETLRQVFQRNDAERLVDDFRGRLRGAGGTAELHALHFDPLQVAADLIGRPIERPVTSGLRRPLIRASCPSEKPDPTCRRMATSAARYRRI